MRKTNQKGIDLIKKFEGFRRRAYQDSVGVWTIGYGHTNAVFKDLFIDERAAEIYLCEDLKLAEAAVDVVVKVPITENMFAALVSFVFNLGEQNLAKSALLYHLNSRSYEKAADEFLKWVYAGNQKLIGLEKRRIAERQLFLTGIGVLEYL